ncbi:MAG: hypothetical protein B0D96_04665, partial [Candidatus Sedimenticola endophacoides]
VAALLVDARAADPARLGAGVEAILERLDGMDLVRPARFTEDPAEYQALWSIRKGLFPAVGAVRETGTTVIIEDVAFPVEELAGAVRRLQALLLKYHYHEALIFGHALEGNLHFVFTQYFAHAREVERYRGLMDEVCRMVVEEYDGSLKAEHGTGRNMAPFVEMEWGSDAYRLMWELKHLFDPGNLLNPGVILNRDPAVHLQHLKPLPAAGSEVDKCIECGFCEAICPSRELTLTPRQRIAVWREICRLEAGGGQADALRRNYVYQGMESCAADGLCATRCPVGIDTGALIKRLRSEARGPRARRVGHWIDHHFAPLTGLTRGGLRAVGLFQDLLGDGALARLSATLGRVSGGRLPVWHPAMPRAATALPRMLPSESGEGRNGTVVYFPSCVTRTMGPAKGDPFGDPLHQRMRSLLRKAGYRALFPPSPGGLCCGQPLQSKGLAGPAADTLRRLEQALWEASGEGRHPVLCDTSPCTLRMIEGFTRPLKLYEPVGFITEHLLPHLECTGKRASVALHLTCTSRKLGLAQPMLDLARRCASEVVVPEEEGCCGFAGDKGFTLPQLNAAALRRLREQIPEGCALGVSNSRTCEIGLARHAGIPYQSIVYLVDDCHRARG